MFVRVVAHHYQHHTTHILATNTTPHIFLQPENLLLKLNAAYIAFSSQVEAVYLLLNIIFLISLFLMSVQ